MYLKQHILTISLFVAFAHLSTGLIAQIRPDAHHMQPIKKDGKYYYNDQDTHEHINLKKALTFLAKNLSPARWVKGIMAKFYPSDDKSYLAKEAHDKLQPTQMIPSSESIEPKFIWIGHASFLIQINGFNILTDPIFGDVKVGPLTISERKMQPGIKLDDLPIIDAIVLSHNHSDHTDTNTLMFIAKKYDPVVYVPEGDKELVQSMGFTHVVENTWWDNNTLSKNGKTLTITNLPAYHNSVRFSLSSYRASLWASWMMSTDNTNIYFAGDTAYGPHFKEIGQSFPNIDIALLPIGPTCAGENLHKHSHVDAKEAVDAFIDLGAHIFVPMHYATFFLGENHFKHPLEKLPVYWREKQQELQDRELIFARCGCEYRIEHEPVTMKTRLMGQDTTIINV